MAVNETTLPVWPPPLKNTFPCVELWMCPVGVMMDRKDKKLLQVFFLTTCPGPQGTNTPWGVLNIEHCFTRGPLWPCVVLPRILHAPPNSNIKPTSCFTIEQYATKLCQVSWALPITRKLPYRCWKEFCGQRACNA